MNFRNVWIVALVAAFLATPFSLHAQGGKDTENRISPEQQRSIETVAYITAHFATLCEERRELHGFAPDLYPINPDELCNALPNIDVLLTLPDGNVMAETRGTCRSIWPASSKGRWQALLLSQNPGLPEFTQAGHSNVSICISEKRSLDLTLKIPAPGDTKSGVKIVFGRDFSSRAWLRDRHGTSNGHDFLSEWQDGQLYVDSRSWAERNYRFIPMAYVVHKLNFLSNNLEKFNGCRVLKGQDLEKCARLIWEHELGARMTMWRVSESLPIPMLIGNEKPKLKLMRVLPRDLQMYINYSNSDHEGIRNCTLETLKRTYPALYRHLGTLWERMAK